MSPQRRLHETLEAHFGEDGYVRLLRVSTLHRWNTIVAPDGVVTQREAAALLGYTVSGVNIAAKQGRLTYGRAVDGMKTVTVASVRALHDEHRRR